MSLTGTLSVSPAVTSSPSFLVALSSPSETASWSASMTMSPSLSASSSGTASGSASLSAGASPSATSSYVPPPDVLVGFALLISSIARDTLLTTGVASELRRGLACVAGSDPSNVQLHSVYDIATEHLTTIADSDPLNAPLSEGVCADSGMGGSGAARRAALLPSRGRALPTLPTQGNTSTGVVVELTVRVSAPSVSSAVANGTGFVAKTAFAQQQLTQCTASVAAATAIDVALGNATTSATSKLAAAGANASLAPFLVAAASNADCSAADIRVTVVSSLRITTTTTGSAACTEPTTAPAGPAPVGVFGLPLVAAGAAIGGIVVGALALVAAVFVTGSATRDGRLQAAVKTLLSPRPGPSVVASWGREAPAGVGASGMGLGFRPSQLTGEGVPGAGRRTTAIGATAAAFVRVSRSALGRESAAERGGQAAASAVSPHRSRTAAIGGDATLSRIIVDVSRDDADNDLWRTGRLLVSHEPLPVGTLTARRESAPGMTTATGRVPDVGYAGTAAVGHNTSSRLHPPAVVSSGPMTRSMFRLDARRASAPAASGHPFTRVPPRQTSHEVETVFNPVGRIRR